MTTKTIKTCDFCGKEVVEFYNLSAVQGSNLLLLCRNKDICRSCIRKLEKKLLKEGVNAFL